MSNGVCNNGSVAVAATFTLGLKQVGDPLSGAKNVVVLPPPATPAALPPMVPISPGCVPNSDVLQGPLPAEVTAGEWKVYLITCLAGRRDCATVESNQFEVK